MEDTVHGKLTRRGTYPTNAANAREATERNENLKKEIEQMEEEP
jgi:hypothetical protein